VRPFSTQEQLKKEPEAIKFNLVAAPSPLSSTVGTMETTLANSIAQIKKEGRYRVFFDIEREAGKYPKALKHSKDLPQEEVIAFCSNDYLCMGQHPKVIMAMKDVLDKSGAGAGGTRNISGTTPHHSQLEKELAMLHGKEKALVFTSCFVANDSSISTIAKMLPGCQIFSDADNHSSLIEGVRHSGCIKHVWRHNDVAHLEELLSKAPREVPKLIVFESVYSMDGDIAPLKEICDVADEYGAITFLDEVHAVGLYGPSGGGVAQERNLDHRISLISGTLAKGFGVMGGYIAGSAVMVDIVRSFAPGFIFTSSLPPCVVAGATASIRHLKTSQVERDNHQLRSSQLKTLLLQAHIPYMHAESHIVPVMVGNAELCKAASDLLLSKHKFYVQPINFPTVSRGTERLRITPGPQHTETMLKELVTALIDVWNVLGLRFTK
jgi:5-aminolevulinate synthase